MVTWNNLPDAIRPRFVSHILNIHKTVKILFD